MGLRALLPLALGAFALAGCATPEGYRQQTEQFLGVTSDGLIVERGSPTAIQTLSDGSEVWTYVERERRTQPASTRTIPRERTVTFTDEDGNQRTRVEEFEDVIFEPAKDYIVECETRFVVSPEGRVVDFRFEGSGCVAPEIY